MQRWRERLTHTCIISQSNLTAGISLDSVENTNMCASGLKQNPVNMSVYLSTVEGRADNDHDWNMLVK